MQDDKMEDKAGLDITEVEFTTFPSNGSKWGIQMQDGKGSSIYATEAKPATMDRFESTNGVVVIPDAGIDATGATVSWALDAATKAWAEIRMLGEGWSLVENSRRLDGSTLTITFKHAVGAPGLLKKFYAA